jgi:membrane protease FtsH catalytic subunit (EC 3.4.24.-)
MVMIVLFNLFNQPPVSPNDLSYTEFLTKVRQGEVASVKIQGSRISGVLVNDQRFTSYAPDDPTLVDTLVKSNVQVKAEPQEEAPWYMTVLIPGFPCCFLSACGYSSCVRCRAVEERPCRLAGHGPRWSPRKKPR